jgi:hypothetical protein
MARLVPERTTGEKGKKRGEKAKGKHGEGENGNRGRY